MPEEHRKFYGRRKGKKLGQEQSQRLETLLPRYDLPDMGALPRPLWMEIGFGGGEHLVHLASVNPDVHIIGCEPFQNGVVKCLKMLEDSPQDNLFVHAGDARDVLDILPEGCLERVYLLYPDPWEKLRHQKRRFIGQDNLTSLARVMAPQAQLRFATDIPHYVKTALEEVHQHADFTVLQPPSEQPWPQWHRTRYEEKALRERRTPAYTIFERLKSC